MTIPPRLRRSLTIAASAAALFSALASRAAEDDAAAAIRRAHAAVREGNYPEAVKQFNAALRLDPKNVVAWCDRGHAYADLGEYERAIADFSEAIRLDPKSLDAYTSRAWAYSEQDDFAKAVADYGAALRISPGDAELYSNRAICQTALGKHAEALADLVKAVELRPDEASYRGLRGAAQLALGKHAEGRTDLLKAIQLNRGDAGAAYKPDAKGELSPEALKHGEEQVRRLLADRPPLAEHAEAAAVFRQWAARKFAGEDIGETIDWDPTPPTDSDAENYSPIPGQRGRILVDLNYQHGPKKGQPRTFEELWSRVIFELHNIAYARQFVKLNNDAAAQKITKEQFVYGIWKHEHQAMQLTRAFYAQVFLPWAEKQKLATDPELWFALQWDEVDEAMVGFMDRSAYPWRPYGRQYDWWTVRNLHQDGKLKRALRLLEEMSAEEQHPLDLAEVYLWIGRCQLESDRAEQAVKALTEAIRLNGRLAAAYEFRGAAQKKLGREAEAEADLAKARQLAPEEKR